MIQKIFLDCGANLGQGFERWSSFLNLNIETTQVHMFEPIYEFSKILSKKYSHPNFIIHNEGVWNENTNRILNIENTDLKWTTNILEKNFKIPEHTNTEFMSEWPPKFSQNIKCINFSEFIINNFTKDQKIFLKLDIEGCEYEVLDRMIEDNSINYIDAINIEFHSFLRKDVCKPDQFYIDILKERNIQIIDWAGGVFNVL